MSDAYQPNETWKNHLVDRPSEHNSWVRVTENSELSGVSQGLGDEGSLIMNFLVAAIDKPRSKNLILLYGSRSI